VGVSFIGHMIAMAVPSWRGTETGLPSYRWTSLDSQCVDWAQLCSIRGGSVSEQNSNASRNHKGNPDRCPGDVDWHGVSDPGAYRQEKRDRRSYPSYSTGRADEDSLQQELNSNLGSSCPQRLKEASWKLLLASPPVSSASVQSSTRPHRLNPIRGRGAENRPRHDWSCGFIALRPTAGPCDS